jgi:hypothetical protein
MLLWPSKPSLDMGKADLNTPAAAALSIDRNFLLRVYNEWWKCCLQPTDIA